MIKNTVASVLEGKHLHQKISSCAMLETYEETSIVIPVNITEKGFDSVARKILGASGTGGTGSEALQGKLLKFGEDSKKLRTSVETFVDWLANGSLPWATYRAFIPFCLITLDKQPIIRPVGVGETRRHIFAKIVIKVTGPEKTMVCQDDQLCAGLKAVIEFTVHKVQAI